MGVGVAQGPVSPGQQRQQQQSQHLPHTVTQVIIIIIISSGVTCFMFPLVITVKSWEQDQNIYRRAVSWANTSNGQSSHLTASVAHTGSHNPATGAVQ